MRVTAEIWVAALTRRVFSSGGFAAVVSRGAGAAGAIHVIVRGRMGEVALYRPAPQASYDTARPDDRFFVAAGEMDMDALDRLLEKERRFDPDIWVVEIEPGQVPIEQLIEIRPE